MSEQTISKSSRNAISSPESAGGPSPCVSPDGLTTDPSGPDRRPVSRSASQEKAGARQMNDTFPPNLLDWYGMDAPKCCSENKSQARLFSERLQSHLENGLQKRLNGRGSTIYRTAWKQHVTPLGRLISRLRASGHRISANGHFSGPTILDLPQVGWPTAMVPNGGRVVTDEQLMTGKRADGTKVQIGLENAVTLAGWGTPVAHEARLGYQNRRNGKKGSQKSLTTEAIDYLDPTRGDPSLAGWPTPQAGTPAQNGNSPAGNTDSSRATVAAIKDSPAPARLTVSGKMLTGCSAGMESGGQLNPEHSRWLMGFPAEWGSCGATAMQSIRGRRKSSSKCSKKPEPSVFD